MRTALAMFVCCLVAAALQAKPPESNCLGEYRPDILLEREMVQGKQITPEDLEGKIVFFVFYRRDCYGCEHFAMPRLQNLYNRYRESKCVLVFAINTAFDKDVHPKLADVNETREHLKRMRWEMPVARDYDELSVELFELDEISGTPQVVILDQRGTVRAHDWYSDEKEWTHLEATFDRLAANLNCDCHTLPREVTQGCSRSYETFKAGDYKKAWDEADMVCNSPSYDDKDRADAEYLKKFVEDLAQRRFRRIEDNFTFDPEAAITHADPAIESFRGCPGTDVFVDKVKAWKDSPALADFRRVKADLEGIEAELAKLDPKDEPARIKHIERLEKLAATAGSNAVGARARNHVAAAKGKPEPAGSGRANAKVEAKPSREAPAGARPNARSRERQPRADAAEAKPVSDTASRTAVKRAARGE